MKRNENQATDPAELRRILLERWCALCGQLELSGEIKTVGEELLATYSQPNRHYHNLQHLTDCFEMLEDVVGRATNPLAIEAAIFFHDAVYEMGTSDNEERSATLACNKLAQLGASDLFAKRVAALVIATKHNQAIDDEEDARLLCDIDLSILAQPTPRYTAYAEAIYRETGANRSAFVTGRSAFLESMLKRPTIFQTTGFRERHEETARTNMQREWDRLQAEAEGIRAAGNAYETLRTIITAQPHPLLFVTISGAHLYGFPSQDSDYDLRGVHILSLNNVIGLHQPQETIEVSDDKAGLELDLVTHDVRKFFALLLKRNGYVLEQLYSPLVLHTTPEHQELKEIMRANITKHHAHHYLGFARKQRELFQKEQRIKPLLYTYRVLLTGIHRMRTGEVEANIVKLNETFKLPYLDDLVTEKVQGTEKGLIEDADLAFHQNEYERLVSELEMAHDSSVLPEMPRAHDALNALLIRLRMEHDEA